MTPPTVITPESFAQALAFYRKNGGKSLWDAERAIAAWKALRLAAMPFAAFRIEGGEYAQIVQSAWPTCEQVQALRDAIAGIVPPAKGVTT